MLFFLREDFCGDAAGRGVGVADVVDHLGVGLDGDALGDQIFLDHGGEVGEPDVLGGGEGRAGRGVVDVDLLGVGAGGQAIGVEVGGAAELDDALGELIGVGLLFLRVLEELLGDGLGVDAGGGEVVSAVAEDADDLGGKSGVEQLEDGVTVGGIAGGGGAGIQGWAGAPA